MSQHAEISQRKTTTASEKGKLIKIDYIVVTRDSGVRVMRGRWDRVESRPHLGLLAPLGNTPDTEGTCYGNHT